jgi:DHA2 family multidrug resistance protein
VVDLTLLRERNFALSNFFYFMFGFVLIGSTVLIPQMLQGLFGYTAYQSGWAISPGGHRRGLHGAAGGEVHFPEIRRDARLIAGSFLIQAAALWYYSQLDLGADYNSFIVPLIQGFGVAFLFIPVSNLAYSYLPKELNNKASSLTNLFRNLGSSFGIAFVTTMQARREQVHQNFLVEHLSVGDPTVMARLQAYEHAIDAWRLHRRRREASCRGAAGPKHGGPGKNAGFSRRLLGAGLVLGGLGGCWRLFIRPLTAGAGRRESKF